MAVQAKARGLAFICQEVVRQNLSWLGKSSQESMLLCSIVE